MPTRIFTIVLASLVLSNLALAAAPRVPDGVSFQPDITYATVAGEELKLNLAMPRDASGALPCVVVIHGGGWAAGNRNGHNDLTLKFAERGYVSATLSYRFAPKHPFPAQVQDVKAAVRFLRANAEKFHIDPRRIGATGFSAGAHLSMMLGTMDKEDGLDDVGDHPDQSSKVQAVVAFFGPTDFSLQYPPASANIVKTFLGASPQDNPDLARRASPVSYVNAGDAPTLIYQGTNDPLVPHDQAIVMANALTKAKVPGRIELLLNASHGWGGAEMQRTAVGMQAFFEEQLKKK